MLVRTCRKFLYISFTLIFLPLFAHAEVFINEIMYDLSGSDAGREWVEIYNSGPGEVTIITGGTNAAWRFSDGSQHTLTLIDGSATLVVGAYAIIADNTTTFLTDWSSFSGNLFDSSFSLNNTSGDISIFSSKDGTTLNQVFYNSSQGAKGDGNSLQKSSSGWIAANPTPGLTNSSTSISTATDQTGATINVSSNQTSGQNISINTSSHYEAIPISNVESSMEIKVGAGRNRLGAVGSPMEFKAETGGPNSRQTYHSWSFGDGTIGGGSIVVHTYMYPGEYIVVLNTNTIEGEAVSRTNVKILDPEVSISYASQDRIEIYNKSKEEINMFGRAIMFGEKMFIFPKDTIIKGGQKISFPSHITGLEPKDTNGVYLFAIGENINTLVATKKFNEYKTGEISRIKSEIDVLQKQLATAYNNKTPTKTESSNTQIESENNDFSQSATVILASQNNAKPGWFEIIKKFFLNRN